MTEFDVLLRFALLVLAGAGAIGIFRHALAAYVDVRAGACTRALAAIRSAQQLDLLDLLARAWTGRGYQVVAYPLGLRMLAAGEALIVQVSDATTEDQLDAAVRALRAEVERSGADAGVLVLGASWPDAALRRPRCPRVRLLGATGLWTLIGPTLPARTRARARWRQRLAEGWRVLLPASGALVLAGLACVLWLGLGLGPDLLARTPPSALAPSARTLALDGACASRRELATLGFEGRPAIRCGGQ